MKIAVMFILLFAGNIYASAPVMVLEMSPVRAAIGELDARLEWRSQSFATVGIGVSQMTRQAEQDSTKIDRESAIDLHWTVYPGLLELPGLFFGPKISTSKTTKHFAQGLPVRTYSEFASTPSANWTSEIERVYLGARIGGRWNPAKHLTFSMTGELLSTLNEQVSVIEESDEFSDVSHPNGSMDRYVSRLMIHVGILIP